MLPKKWTSVLKLFIIGVSICFPSPWVKAMQGAGNFCVRMIVCERLSCYVLTSLFVCLCMLVCKIHWDDACWFCKSDWLNILHMYIEIYQNRFSFDLCHQNIINYFGTQWQSTVLADTIHESRSFCNTSQCVGFYHLICTHVMLISVTMKRMHYYFQKSYIK